MDKLSNKKQYDLEERTFEFAKKVRFFIKQVHKSIANIEDSKQLVKSSGSVGANYIEANEALSKKDFLMRLNISRKEAKGSRYWLRLLDGQEELLETRHGLLQEATELMNIFGSIINKSK